MKYFDAHTHLQFAAFDEDREEAFLRSREAGVGMNLVGTQLDTSRSAVAYANAHEDVWASVGLHPIHTSRSFHDEKELGAGGAGFTSRGEVFDFDAYEVLAREPKTIAIGECGLDYFRLNEETKKTQIEVFIAQIELANKVGKPLMLHIRSGKHGEVANSAYDDALELLKTHPPTGRAGANSPGDVHFFAGSWETARKFLDLGFTLSFTGVITFDADYEEVVRNTPLNMILSETDAPYITPVPHRGKRNEPIYIPNIVSKIAEIKGLEIEAVREQILLTAKRVFNIV